MTNCALILSTTRHWLSSLASSLNQWGLGQSLLCRKAQLISLSDPNKSTDTVWWELRYIRIYSYQAVIHKPLAIRLNFKHLLTVRRSELSIKPIVTLAMWTTALSARIQTRKCWEGVSQALNWANQCCQIITGCIDIQSYPLYWWMGEVGMNGQPDFRPVEC